MAFPTTNQRVALNNEFNRVDSTVKSMKSTAETLGNKMGIENVATDEIIDVLYDQVFATKEVLTEAVTIPGLPQFYKDQFDDQTIDWSAEYNALVAALDAVGLRIINDMPTDASNWLLARKLDPAQPTGFFYRTFTPTQLVNLKADVDALAAQIE